MFSWKEAMVAEINSQIEPIFLRKLCENWECLYKVSGGERFEPVALDRHTM